MASASQVGFTKTHWAVMFLSAQIMALVAVVAWDMDLDARLAAGRGNGGERQRRSEFKPPSAGSRVTPLQVQGQHGRLVDLTAGSESQCLLIIDSCQSCVGDTLREYDRLWRDGGRIAVVTRSNAAEIAQARQDGGWRLPVYSESSRSSGEPWKSCWRPWVTIVRQGRIVYAQRASETWRQALERVKEILPRREAPAVARAPAERTEGLR